MAKIRNTQKKIPPITVKFDLVALSPAANRRIARVLKKALKEALKEELAKLPSTEAVEDLLMRPKNPWSITIGYVDSDPIDPLYPLRPRGYGPDA